MLKLFNRLAKDRSAAVAVIVALGNLAVITVAGLTIDAARAEYVRERLISALDAAAIAGGRVINNGKSTNCPAGTPGGTPQWKCDAWMFFHANFPTGYMGTKSAAPTSSDPNVYLNSPYDTTLTVQQYLSLPTYFMAVFGFNNVTISAQSTAQAGKVELALVLDNTGSMGQDAGTERKIDALKTAATTLADTMLGNNSGQVRISLVPFTMTVNVGNQYQGVSWIDPQAEYIYAGLINPYTNQPYQDVFTDKSGKNVKTDRFKLWANLAKAQHGAHWAGCIESRPPPYDVTDAAADPGTPGTQYVPFFAPDEPDSSSDGYENSYLKDVAGDPSAKRSDPNPGLQEMDILKYTNPSITSPIDKVRKNNYYASGPNSGCKGIGITLASVQPLTQDLASLTGQINAMQPMGDTYIPTGLQMGWMTISPNSPFSSGAYPQPLPYGTTGLTKAVILLTDGCNHLINPNQESPPVRQDAACDTWTGLHGPNLNDSEYTSIGYIWQSRIGIPSQMEDMNARKDASDNITRRLCDNMKKDDSSADPNVQVYTILLGLSSDAASSALEYCATGGAKGGNFYDVVDAGQLQNAFLEIQEKLTLVRLLK